jgi:hypothetical protein
MEGRDERKKGGRERPYHNANLPKEGYITSPFSPRDPARVCDKCYKRVLQKRMPFASSVVNNAIDFDNLSKTFASPTNLEQPNQGGDSQGGSPSPVRGAGITSNSLNIERTIDLSGNR